MIWTVVFVAVLAALGYDSPPVGSIRGQVVNASRDEVPVGGAEIVLRVMLEGQFVIAAEGAADADGYFVFDNLPADPNYIYLPGANHQGVHYPSTRVRLSPRQPHAQVKVPIHETVREPNPLVLRRHEITIDSASDAVRVREKLVIDNDSQRTYVGQPAHEGGRAATLRLAIPANFRRVTFEQEFYGRQFTLIDQQLVTDIPWTPGQRELTFSYVLPNEDRNRVWQRRLDLPCQQLRIEVRTDAPEQVSANLGVTPIHTEHGLLLESTGETLPAGHLLRVQLEAAPFSLASHGRWLALTLLLGLVGITGYRWVRGHRATRMAESEVKRIVSTRRAA